MSKEIRVFRTERKYPLSSLQVSGLFSRLSAVMNGDSYNGTNTYMVRSLYFDTIYHDDYFEKMAGVERRRKIRLRIYDVNSPTAKLEIKEKQRFTFGSINAESSETLLPVTGCTPLLRSCRYIFARSTSSILSIDHYLPVLI